VLDVRLHRRLADVPQWSGADDLALRGADPRSPAARGEVFGELLPVAAGDAARGRRLAGRVLAHLEAAQPLAGVVREVGLAQLAVVHDVDAALDLLVYYL